MIDFAPSLTETIVLALPAKSVEQRIEKGISDRVFEGVLTGQKFSISARIFRPTQFQPVMKGAIEGTSKGSIIFLQYQLMPSTRLYLFFYSFIFIVAATAASIAERNILYGAGGIAMILVVRWIALSNLKLQRDPARKVLLQQLS